MKKIEKIKINIKKFWAFAITTAKSKPKIFIEICVILITFGTIYLQYESLQEQRIIGAWQIITTKAPGNSGKREAIEFLAKQGRSLQGIDMSMETNVGKVYLQKLNLGGLNVDLGNAHFGGAILQMADFKGANLWRADFKGANLWRADFKGAILQMADFKGAILQEADFEGANLWWAHFKGADLQEAHFEGADLLGADFEGSKYFDEAIFKDNYIFNKEYLPIAPENSKYKFVFTLNDDGAIKSEPDEKYFIHRELKTQNK